MSAFGWVRLAIFGAYVVARVGFALYDAGYDAGRASARVACAFTSGSVSW